MCSERGWDRGIGGSGEVGEATDKIRQGELGADLGPKRTNSTKASETVGNSAEEMRAWGTWDSAGVLAKVVVPNVLGIAVPSVGLGLLATGVFLVVWMIRVHPHTRTDPEVADVRASQD